MRPHLLLTGLCFAMTFGAATSAAQPRAQPPAGDLSRVRACSAVVSTFAPLRRDPRAQCTEMDCMDGFSVDTSAQGRGPGLYRIEVEADGQRFSCEQRLPFASCDAPSACLWRRPGSNAHLGVVLSGCALPAAQHTLPEVQFEGLCPVRVSVRMWRNGSLLGSFSSDVNYRRVVANGEACGPMCAQGQFASPAVLRP